MSFEELLVATGSFCGSVGATLKGIEKPAVIMFIVVGTAYFGTQYLYLLIFRPISYFRINSPSNQHLCCITKLTI